PERAGHQNLEVLQDADTCVNQVLEERVFLESQRDSATKPRVARNELPWVIVIVIVAQNTTPPGLRPPVHVHQSRNPVGVFVFLIPLPQGSSFLATLIGVPKLFAGGEESLWNLSPQ